LCARAARRFEDFSLAGRALPLPLIFGSLAATYVGPGFSVGFVGKGFNSGFLFLGIGLVYALQNILVGWLVAPRLRALKDCHTLGDIIGQKYQRTSHVMAGIISVVLCSSLAAVMIKAGGVVVTDIIALPNWSAVVIVAGVTTLYTTFGGLRASVITDAFQFTAFALLLPAIFIWIWIFHASGTEGVFVQQAMTATQEGCRAMTWIDILGLVTAFLLGETLIPPYANRALASRSTQISRNGFILAGGFSVFWFVVMLSMGVVARGIVPKGTHEDAVLLSLVRRTLSIECYALLLVVLVSIIMSSLDSLLNAGAVSLAEDVVKPFVSLSDHQSLQIGRCATVCIAGTAALGALIVPGIIDGLIQCYSLWAPAILPALIFGLWIKKPRPLAGILSMITGLIVAIFFLFLVPHAAALQSLAKIPAILPALGAALVAYIAGHILGSPHQEESS
jgi:SSS family solute:Na+ symporter